MTFKRRLVATTAMGLALAAPGMSGAATAQDADADDLVLEEITVTARKREESLQTVPVTVSAFSAENIQQFNMLSVDDIARYTPGFSFSRAFGRTTERPVIRGAANILAGVQFGVEAGTAYFLDGVYYPGDLQTIDLESAARVEVIKGPQSALYGRNSYAGAISIISKGGTDEFEGDIRAELAEHDQYVVYGSFAGPIIEDVLTARVSMRHYEYGGEWRNAPTDTIIGGEESQRVNIAVDWDPADNVSIMGRFGYSRDRDEPRPFALVKDINNCYPGLRSQSSYDPNYLFFLNPPFGGIFPDTAVNSSNPNQYYCGVIPTPDVATQDLDGIPFLGVERDMYTASIRSDFDFADGHTFTVMYGYRDQDLKTGSDSDHQPGTMNFFPISPFFSIGQADGLFNTAGTSRANDWSIEARVQSPGDKRFSWMFGFFYYDQVIANNDISFAYADRFEFTGPRETRETVQNTAGFAMIEYDITDKLSASAEIRIAEEKKGLQDFLTPNATDTFGPAEETFNSTAPRFVVNYQATDDIFLYANYAIGIKPGGLNGSVGADVGRPEYEEEESDAYEAGIKADWLDGRLRTNLAFYLNKTDNYQLTTAVGQGQGNVTSIVTNQGDAEVKGLEFDMQAVLTEQLRVGGTYAYTDAEFTDGCDEFQFVLTSGGYKMSETPNVPLVPLDADGNPIVGDCSIAGNTIPMTSEHQASMYLQFEQQISDTASFFFNADWTYESSKFVQVHNGMETGGASIFGFRAGVRGENWELAFFGRNIFDEDSIPMATRWFDVFAGFRTTNPAGSDVSLLGPRAPFVSFRRGSQFGANLQYTF